MATKRKPKTWAIRCMTCGVVFQHTGPKKEARKMLLELFLDHIMGRPGHGGKIQAEEIVE